MKQQTALFFLLLEFILYPVIIMSDFFGLLYGSPLSILKFSAIFLFLILGCSLSAFQLKEKKRRPKECIPWLSSFLFSFLADYFLLFDTHYLVGIFFFILVQFCYAKILSNRFPVMLLCGLTGLLFMHTLSVRFYFSIDVTVLFAAFYASCLILNLITAWLQKNRWLSFGVSLLLLCDIHVGCTNITAYLPVNPSPFLYTWIQMAYALIWLFYIPAQFCILKAYTLHLSAQNIRNASL